MLSRMLLRLLRAIRATITPMITPTNILMAPF